jgi:hypothetical protein
LCIVSVGVVLFSKFLMLHHMWASQERFNIKWQQVCKNLSKMFKMLPLKSKWKCDEKFPILAKKISPKKGNTKQNIILKLFFVYLCEISHKKTTKSTMASSTFQCWIIILFWHFFHVKKLNIYKDSLFSLKIEFLFE